MQTFKETDRLNIQSEPSEGEEQRLSKIALIDSDKDVVGVRTFADSRVAKREIRADFWARRTKSHDNSNTTELWKVFLIWTNFKIQNKSIPDLPITTKIFNWKLNLIENLNWNFLTRCKTDQIKNQAGQNDPRVDALGDGADVHQLEPDTERHERNEDAAKTQKKQRPPTESFNGEEADERTKEVGGRRQTRKPNGFRFVSNSRHLDDGGAVVHDRVDAGHLLDHRQHAADQQQL